jgi:hypothetical protein
MFDQIRVKIFLLVSHLEKKNLQTLSGAANQLFRVQASFFFRKIFPYFSIYNAHLMYNAHPKY